MSDSGFLVEARTFYDALAVDYRDRIGTDLTARPIERAALTAFAELVAASGQRAVADVGSGYGTVTAFLAAAGVDAFGVDLSPVMVELARKSHPGLRFEVGTMTALDLPDASLGGVLAWYSLIHVPSAERPTVAEELARVLAPGGHVLVAFQVGDEPRHVEAPDGRPVALEFHRLRPEEVESLLREAGLAIVAVTTCEPIDPEPTPQAFVLARKD